MDDLHKQLPLPFDELPQNARPPVVKGATIAERFRAFHEINPHVYLALVSLAREVKRQGITRASMKMLFETLRIKFWLKTRGEHWKLNNDYTALYARLVMRQEPDLADFFETRERREQTHA